MVNSDQGWCLTLTSGLHVQMHTLIYNTHTHTDAYIHTCTCTLTIITITTINNKEEEVMNLGGRGRRRRGGNEVGTELIYEVLPPTNEIT